LVDDFTQWLRRRMHEPSRLMIVPNGEHKPLFTDIWLPEVSLLVEAKGNSTREAFRMAVGQLADYSRFLDPGIMKAILVPSRPRRDLEDLARSQDLIVFWPEPGAGFRCTNEEVARML
jgi:hypothetical protein